VEASRGKYAAEYEQSEFEKQRIRSQWLSLIQAAEESLKGVLLVL